jgi:hypothetical protein
VSHFHCLWTEIIARQLRPSVVCPLGHLNLTLRVCVGALFCHSLPQNRKTPKLIQVVQGYHGGNDVEGWVEATRALVGFGATGITALPSVEMKEIFDAAGESSNRALSLDCQLSSCLCRLISRTA